MPDVEMDTGGAKEKQGMGDLHQKLTSGSLLARNTVYNLLGNGLPLLVGVVAVPLLVDALGTERFGILTIIWMAIGYFSLFDFGLGRALTKFVAGRLGSGRQDEIPALIGTALSVMAILGVAAALLIGSLAPWLVYDVLNVPAELHAETLTAMRWLAGTLPFVITTAALIGVLQAHQYFGWVSAVRAPLGVFNFLGPLVAIQVVDSLAIITIILAIGRVAAWCVYGTLVFKTLPHSGQGLGFEKRLLGELLSFGGWLTVSNVIGPLMVYFDRFLIGAVLTMSAVAYYTTPYDMVTKLWMLPSALIGVLFPALSTALQSDEKRAAQLFRQSGFVLMTATFPILLGIAFFAPEGLELWLGTEFAENSTPVLRLLALGVFINSLARIPAALLQSHGRADLTAKIHLIELPVYFLVLWEAVTQWGIVGAALAWVARIGADTIALFLLSRHIFPEVSAATRDVLVHVLVLSTVFLLVLIPTSVAGKAVLYFATLVVFGISLWRPMRPILVPLIKRLKYAAT